MTEAAILALIALGGMLLFSVITLTIVVVTLKAKPTHIKVQTEFGTLDVEYDTKADE